MPSPGEHSNQEIASLLSSVAAALNIKKASIFQIRAYETAADAIEHSTSEIKDLWEEGKLDQIPGVGENITKYLTELFEKGKVSHFEAIKNGIEPATFEFLDIPGVGPKTGLELAKLGVKNLVDLKKKLQDDSLVEAGFSEKLAPKILQGLQELSGRTGRMLLPYASVQAERILEYLKKGPGVVAADPLGSLRRKVATIGDLDFAASSKEPEKVVEYFIKMPGVARVLDHGPNKANLVLNSGLEVDLLVGDPESYGALLQHFTGSKHHNIKLRSFALKKGLSLNEYGVKKLEARGKKQELISTKTEDELYKLLGMDTPEPEIREDNGEIEAALAHKLPNLIKPEDIKGDLHLHSNYPMISPSHGPGINSMEEIVKKGQQLGYEYIGISDHPLGFRSIPQEKTIKILEERTKKVKQLQKNTKNTRVLNGLEIDILPDGTLSVPNEILETLDYSIAGIHSGHRSGSENITKRIMTALENPYVDIISHPTGRILNERDSYEADWEVIFKLAAKNKKLMEINAYPNRLDLRDDLIRLALKFGVKFVIDTDAHEVAQMENMPYGVALARRGWVEAKDVVNSWDWKTFSKWFNIKT